MSPVVPRRSWNFFSKYTIFAVLNFMYFVKSNIQHVSGFWGLRPRPPRGLCPWTPQKDFCPQAPSFVPPQQTPGYAPVGDIRQIINSHVFWSQQRKNYYRIARFNNNNNWLIFLKSQDMSRLKSQARFMSAAVNYGRPVNCSQRLASCDVTPIQSSQSRHRRQSPASASVE